MDFVERQSQKFTHVSELCSRGPKAQAIAPSGLCLTLPTDIGPLISLEVLRM
jgi:hypothetical protein